MFNYLNISPIILNISPIIFKYKFNYFKYKFNYFKYKFNYFKYKFKYFKYKFNYFKLKVKRCSNGIKRNLRYNIYGTILTINNVLNNLYQLFSQEKILPCVGQNNSCVL